MVCHDNLSSIESEGHNSTCEDKPKRNLSAYNLFFQHERAKILRQIPERKQGKLRSSRKHGKIGFASLARMVAARWKAIDPSVRKYFDKMAAEDKERYRRELAHWKNSTNMEESRKYCSKDNSEKPAVSEKNSKTATYESLLPDDSVSMAYTLQAENSKEIQLSSLQRLFSIDSTTSFKKTPESAIPDVSYLVKKLDEDCIEFLSGLSGCLQA